MVKRCHITRLSVAFGLIAVTLISGCENWKDRQRFNGVYYPGRVHYVDGNRQNFVTTVRRVSRGLEGARQAAEYESIRYCIKNFGNSEIIWAAGPDRQVTQAEVNNNRLSVSGKCVGW